MTNPAAASLLTPDELALRRRALATRLRRLRTATQPRLSQQAAATYIGLSESTGYRSIGQWESGDVVPSSTWQGALRRYLWCALGLHAHPAEFAALWEEIAICWEWPPLTEVDWRELSTLDCTAGAESPAGLAAGSATLPAQALVPETGEQAGTPAVHRGGKSRLPALLALAALLALLLLAAGAFAPGWIIANNPFHRATPTPAPTPAPPLANLGFEEAGGLTPWAVVGDPACARRLANGAAADGAAAHTGDYFLRVDTDGAPCTSLRYDLAEPPGQGATARFAIWARAAGPTSEQVELVLWPGRHPAGTDGDKEAGQHTGQNAGEPVMGEKGFAFFTVDPGEWRCLEVALPLHASAARPVDLLRAELYFSSDEPVRVDLDEAAIQFGGHPICQGAPPQPANASFETGARHLGWSLVEEGSCAVEVATGSAGSEGGALAGRRYLRVERTAPECRALEQDLPGAPVPGVTYRARMWLRSATTQPVQATLALWALGAEAVSAVQPVVAGLQWRCVETALALPAAARSGDFDRLRLSLAFDTPGAVYALDDAAVAIGASGAADGDAPLCPPQTPLLNGGFEAGATGAAAATGAPVAVTGTDAAPWVELDQCLIDLESDPQAGTAHSGERFARARKDAGCNSIFQDMPAPQHGGQPHTATFSVWVRGPGNLPARGALALRAVSAQTELAELPFKLTDNRWVCLETTLAAQAADVTFWRAEVYFSTEGALYDVDDATLAWGEEGSCPQANYAIERLEWLPGTVGYAGSGVSGLVEVQNLGTKATTSSHPLRFWLAGERGGDTLFEEASGAVTVPPLPAGAGSGPLYFDLPLPSALAEDTTYYLVLDRGATGTAPGATPRLRSLPLRLEPCSAEALFCDIPNGFWAQAEAETWYKVGITSGCRSDTQAYNNLPFCPQQMLSPDTMAVFLLRHLVDPAWRPAEPYRGVYADVPQSHPRSGWIEALYDRLGPVERSNCPQVEGELRFCPQAPLLRGDLLRTLAAALAVAEANTAAGEVQPVDATPESVAEPTAPEPAAGYYVDLAGDPALSALATAFRQAGILPGDDPACPDLGLGPRFCPDAPARRIDAAVWMVRGFGG